MSGNSNQQLRKTIGFNAALSTVVGILIGSGVFFKPQAIYSATNGGPGLGLFSMVNRWTYNYCSRTYCSRSISKYNKTRWFNGIFRRNIWRTNRIFNRLDATNIIRTSNSCSTRNYICPRMC